MESINPIILDNLKIYVEKNPDIPNEMKDLMEELMNVEDLQDDLKEGTDKLYDRTFDKFAKNATLVEWSKKYVK